MPALVGWTVFLWLSRLRNVFADDDLSSAGRTWRVIVVIVFVALAGLTAWTWRRRDIAPDRAHTTLLILCSWTVAFWIVRGGGIIVDDHTLGFTVIHTVLMIVSIGLAAWAWPRRAARAAMRPDTVV